MPQEWLQLAEWDAPFILVFLSNYKDGEVFSQVRQRVYQAHIDTFPLIQGATKT